MRHNVHYLPLFISPVREGLAKELAKDRYALQKLIIDRTSASYKLTFELKKHAEYAPARPNPNPILLEYY